MTNTVFKKKHRSFTLHELHASLILIILMSFLTAVAFMYLLKVFGGSLKEHSALSFMAVMSGYAAVVWFLTTFFAHRFIGPFERLRYELGVVIAGDYRKRLKMRRHDDAYIRAFEDEVNRVIDTLEKKNRLMSDLQRDLFSDLNKILRTMPADDPRRMDLAALRDKAGARLR